MPNSRTWWKHARNVSASSSAIRMLWRKKSLNAGFRWKTLIKVFEPQWTASQTRTSSGLQAVWKTVMRWWNSLLQTDWRMCVEKDFKPRKPSCPSRLSVVLQGAKTRWRARRESNPRPLASETNTLSIWATGAFIDGAQYNVPVSLMHVPASELKFPVSRQGHKQFPGWMVWYGQNGSGRRCKNGVEAAHRIQPYCKEGSFPGAVKKTCVT